MPIIQVTSAVGFYYSISTRRVETTLAAWFDEVLPWCYVPGRPGIDDFEVIWPRIMVHPMWAWKLGAPTDPDWLCDTRVIGRLEDFPASDGPSGLKELVALRLRLEAELRGYH